MVEECKHVECMWGEGQCSTGRAMDAHGARGGRFLEGGGKEVFDFRQNKNLGSALGRFDLSEEKN